MVGGLVGVAIERWLADDLVSELDTRMTGQARAVAAWLETDHDPAAVRRLSAITGTRITITGPDDTLEAAADEYAVTVLDSSGRTVRLSVPIDTLQETRAKMRKRLFVAAIGGIAGCVILAVIIIRAVTGPLRSMARVAEQLARGNYDVPSVPDVGGDLGVLARAMTRMTGEVKARVAEVTGERDLLKTVIGGLVEGVVVIDRDGKVVMVNEIATALVGDAVPKALKPVVKKALAGESADEETVVGTRTVRASARPLSDRGAILVLYDVTRLRALEAVRREFLSNAAHELRTPVTSISGYAETLLSAPKADPETSREFLEIIHRNAGRIASLVDDLLVLDTLGGRATVLGERGPVRVSVVVADAVRTTKGARPSARIETDVPPELSVLATRDGLEHVVQNLVDNAVKYGAGTTVSVAVTTEGDRVRISIADRGPGIPKGMEDRIFERFYRLDAGRSRDIGGSGLGLAIVRSHVEAMGGRVWVEDNAPGARFVVELAQSS